MRNTFIASAFLAVTAILVPYSQVHAATVDTYIATEGPIAKAGLLANIGPSGSKSNGAKAGIVRSLSHLPTMHILLTVPYNDVGDSIAVHLRP